MTHTVTVPSEERAGAGTASLQKEALGRFLRDDEAAVDFCMRFFFITQVWDDLVDKDRPVGERQVCRAFWEALCGIPWNPFYARHAQVLGPVMRAYIADWFAANELERGSVHERTVAFALRDAVAGLVTQCAYLVGGYEWMCRTAPEIRRLAHDEKLENYLRGLR
jgi:hypothetical protein